MKVSDAIIASRERNCLQISAGELGLSYGQVRSVELGEEVARMKKSVKPNDKVTVPR